LAWTYLSGTYARSTAIVDSNFMVGDSRTTSSGFVRRYETGASDDGSAISAYWQSKDYLLASDEMMKSVSDVFTTYKADNTNITVALYGDGSEFGTDSQDISSTLPFVIKKWHVLTEDGGERANYYNVKFTHSDAGSGASILSFRFYWQPSGYLEP